MPKENVWFKKFNVSIGFDGDGKTNTEFEPETPRRKVIVEKFLLREMDMGFSTRLVGTVSAYGEDGLGNALGKEGW